MSPSSHKTLAIVTVPIMLLFLAERPVAGDTNSASAPGSPYPASLVVKGITWDWTSQVRQAPGSDLWPVTWGADDNLYASWGDGGGFGGTDHDGRVRLGFAKIEGTPAHFQGMNVWGGKDAEHPARFGGKCSGMISVSGTLYAWINLQNRPWPRPDITLASSDNDGASWKKVDWIFPGTNGAFRPATFLNFGRDNAQARDRDVYFYGDNVGDDTAACLGRVGQSELRNKAAYEYFAGLDAQGNAQWSSNIKNRRPCFVDPNGDGLSVIFDVPLGRYIATGAHGNVAHLGIFDAANPWGPWTTIGYYDHWDGYPGQGGEALEYSIPTKWISKDGLVLWMVYSAYNPPTDTLDSFNLIKFTLRRAK